MTKKIFAFLLAFIVFISPVSALSIPKQDSSIYVNDYSDVLSEDVENQLISMNQKSDYASGGYVVVATFDFVEDDLYDFSYRLFNSWGIGHEEYDNGILLVLDIGNDNYCYILGSGIEKILSDGEARNIIDRYMEPYFASKNYEQAVLKSSEAFLKVIEDGNYMIADSYDQNGASDFSIFSFLIPMLIMVMFIIVIVSSTSRRRRYGYVPRRHFYYHVPRYRSYRRPEPRPRPTFRPFGGMRSSSSFGSMRSSGGFRSSGGRSHSGGSSRGAGGTRR